MADDMVKKGAVSIPVVSTTDQTEQKIADFLADNPDDPMNDTKKEIRTRFELLPVELQKVIIDDAYPENLLDIARKNKLNYEELGIIEIETTMVLLGMTKPSDYRTEIQEQLKKNDPEVDALVKDINEKIFSPVRDTLEKLYAVQRTPGEYLKDDILEKVTNAGETIQAVKQATTEATPGTPLPAAKPSVSSPSQTPSSAQPTPALSSQEKTVLEKTGVVISPSPTPAPIAPMTMPSRTDVLKGIENPPKAPSAGLIGDKLRTSTPVMPTIKVTDYSAAKPVMPAPSAPTIPAASEKRIAPDPYREQIT